MKVTYYFADGTGRLQPIKAELDKDGNLKRPATGEIIVTRAKEAEVPTDGHFVKDGTSQKVEEPSTNIPAPDGPEDKTKGKGKP